MVQRPRTISVIIPAYNAVSTIDKTLESLRGLSLKPLEVIVVDNGSTDSTEIAVRAFVEKLKPVPLQLLQEEKRGPSAARNRGASVAKGEILAFLDADCVAPPDWLEKISIEMAKGAGAVGGPCRIQASPSPIEVYAAMSWFFGEGPTAPLQNPFAHRFLLGANMALSREVWEKTGGFDESLQVGEDLDLSIRMKESGTTVRSVLALAVTHLNRSSPLKRIRRSFLHGNLQAKIVKRDFRHCLTLSMLEKIWKIPFPFTIALEVFSLTKILLVAALVWRAYPLGTLLAFLGLALIRTLRMVSGLLRQGIPVTFPGGLFILFGWASARLAMELGRLAGSVRYRVFCW